MAKSIWELAAEEARNAVKNLQGVKLQNVDAMANPENLWRVIGVAEAQEKTADGRPSSAKKTQITM